MEIVLAGMAEMDLLLVHLDLQTIVKATLNPWLGQAKIDTWDVCVNVVVWSGLYRGEGVVNWIVLTAMPLHSAFKIRKMCNFGML